MLVNEDIILNFMDIEKPEEVRERINKMKQEYLDRKVANKDKEGI